MDSAVATVADSVAVDWAVEIVADSAAVAVVDWALATVADSVAVDWAVEIVADSAVVAVDWAVADCHATVLGIALLVLRPSGVS